MALDATEGIHHLNERSLQRRRARVRSARRLGSPQNRLHADAIPRGLRIGLLFEGKSS